VLRVRARGRQLAGRVIRHVERRSRGVPPGGREIPGPVLGAVLRRALLRELRRPGRRRRVAVLRRLRRRGRAESPQRRRRRGVRRPCRGRRRGGGRRIRRDLELQTAAGTRSGSPGDLAPALGAVQFRLPSSSAIHAGQQLYRLFGPPDLIAWRRQFRVRRGRDSGRCRRRRPRRDVRRKGRAAAKTRRQQARSGPRRERSRSIEF